MAARTAPTVRRFVAGEVEVGAYFNALASAVNFTLGPPVFQARQTVAQAIGAAFTALLLDTEDFDSDGAHSTVTNTANWVCQVAGSYWGAGVVHPGAAAATNRQAALLKNGTTIPGTQIDWVVAPTTSQFPITIAPTFFTAVVGDIVTLNALSATAVNTFVSGGVQPMLTIGWLSR